MINKVKILMVIVVFFTILFWGAPLQAAKLSGEISFNKKPPFAAVLYVEGGKKASIVAQVDQKNKAFTKKMVVTSIGEDINFLNSDTVEHNIFTNDVKNKVKFDVGLIAPGGQSKVKADWNNGVLIRLGCKIHPKMRTYVAALNTSHFQVFEFDKKTKKYTVDIPDLPEEKVTFKFAIPKYDPITVALFPGKSKTVSITKRGKERGSLVLQLK